MFEYQGVKFKTLGDGYKICDEEAKAYIDRGLDKYGDKLTKIEAIVHKDDIELYYFLNEPIPFDRIRRITGYLVGTLERFNDGKRAEEADRVKHSIDRS